MTTVAGVTDPIATHVAGHDFDTMLAEANGLGLVLPASVWTNDLAIAHKTAEALDAGHVRINDSSRHYFGTPFGGRKNSSLGREESRDELLTYLEQKAVHARPGDPKASLRRLLS